MGLGRVSTSLNPSFGSVEVSDSDFSAGVPCTWRARIDSDQSELLRISFDLSIADLSCNYATVGAAWLGVQCL